MAEPAAPPPAAPPPAGWYPDPHNPQSTQRYWDGARWTDSYAPIDTPIVDPQDPPRRLAALQAVAVAGLIVVAFLEAFNILADARYLGVIDDLLAGGSPSPTAIDDAERLVDVAVIALAAGYLLIGPLCFLPWFHRGYSNLRRLGLRNLRYAPGWAIGSWFIPIFNLFRPKQIANDLYRATHGGTLHATGAISRHPVSPLLHWWWAVYLLSNFIAGAAGNAFTAAGEDELLTRGEARQALEDERAAYLADIVSSGVGVVAAVLAVLVVRRVTADQEAVIASPAATLHTYVTPPAQ